jgi:hypothetical protein
MKKLSGNISDKNCNVTRDTMNKNYGIIKFADPTWIKNKNKNTKNGK